MVQVEDKLKEACLFFEETFLVIDKMSMVLKKKRLTLPPPRFYQVLINIFIQNLSKMAAPRTTTPRPRVSPIRSSKNSITNNEEDEVGRLKIAHLP